MNKTQSGKALLTGKTTEIPTHELREFQRKLKDLLKSGERLVSFFGSPAEAENALDLNAVLADDANSRLSLLRTRINRDEPYHSLTPEYPEFQSLERECFEQYNFRLLDHPWLKPLRYPAKKNKQKNESIETYPFYQLEGKEIHEVGVGPIHAGVIEPGHFRFMCYGETVHHLEIQLGYQHRGLETLLLEKSPALLAPWIETAAGDSSIAHTWAYSRAFEALCGVTESRPIRLLRGIALELERMAMHLAGLSGMATDIGFLPASAAYGRLRTTAINTSMRLCGSRFGRGLIRPGEARAHLEPAIVAEIKSNLALLNRDLPAVNDQLISSKTVQHRLKGTGRLTPEQVRQMGFVGMIARSTDVALDLRSRFQGELYQEIPLQTVHEKTGDCWARACLRIKEINESLCWLSAALQALEIERSPALKIQLPAPAQGSFALSMIEGWRGEVLHYLQTDRTGKLTHYRIQDPSLRNWFALALAVRENAISDFPICNKSFDLSYCGQDL